MHVSFVDTYSLIKKNVLIKKSVASICSLGILIFLKNQSRSSYKVVVLTILN